MTTWGNPPVDPTESILTRYGMGTLDSFPLFARGGERRVPAALDEAQDRGALAVQAAGQLLKFALRLRLEAGLSKGTKATLARPVVRRLHGRSPGG